MTGEPISQMPLATSVDGVNDLMEISKYIGLPGNLYVSRKIPVQKAADLFLNNFPAEVLYEMDGGGAPLTGGVKGYLVMPFNGIFSGVELLSTTTGSLQMDVWKCSYAQFDAGATHPVVGDSITGANYPTIAAGVKYSDATLTGWTAAFSKGDILAFVILNNIGITHATLALAVSRTL